MAASGSTPRNRTKAGGAALDRLGGSLDAAQQALGDLRRELTKGGRDVVKDLDALLRDARKNLRSARPHARQGPRGGAEGRRRQPPSGRDARARQARDDRGAQRRCLGAQGKPEDHANGPQGVGARQAARAHLPRDPSPWTPLLAFDRPRGRPRSDHTRALPLPNFSRE